jgi:2-acylglycerol O-acyltransferase 2
MLAYIVYVLVDKTPEKGGNKIMWMRKLTWWKYMRDFFPVKLIKTVDLSPEKTYIFGYHPHGIIGLGAWVNFITDANDFSELFKGAVC